jgi:hypothetical protein
MKQLFFLLILTFSLSGMSADAQKTSFDDLKVSEMALYREFGEMYKTRDITLQDELNSRILDELESLLKDPRSFEYHFDSLRWTGRIYSPDNKIRFITWNIPAIDGKHTYYGFLQCFTEKGQPCLVFRLHDRSPEISQPESVNLDPGNWWGALYYEVLVNKYKRNRLYTIIGYDLNDRYSNKKVIDVMTFTDSNTPVFGLPVFHIEGKLQNRVIFEYAEDVVMIVRFNEEKKMIVFDHLSPIDPALRNNPRFYAPDSSYDGLRFRKGIWEFVHDVDVRNP